MGQRWSTQTVPRFTLDPVDRIALKKGIDEGGVVIAAIPRGQTRLTCRLSNLQSGTRHFKGADPVIFTHGFNVTENDHEEAAKKLHQKLERPIIAFVWPTTPEEACFLRWISPLTRMQQYCKDTRYALVHRMGDCFKLLFLESANQLPGGGRAHILAHSHGCQIATRMFDEIRRGSAAETDSMRSNLGHVVLAAADVPAPEMKETLTQMAAMRIGVSRNLYVHDADIALAIAARTVASFLVLSWWRGFNRQINTPRAGEKLRETGNPAVVFTDGTASTIDCSGITSHHWRWEQSNHGTLEFPEVQQDIKGVLSGSPDPQLRKETNGYITLLKEKGL